MRYFLALAVTATLSASAVAQTLPSDQYTELPRQELTPPSQGVGGPPGSSIPGADPFMLMLNSRAVQRDMQLTEDQIRHLSHTGKLFRGQNEGGNDAAAAESMEQQAAMSRGAVAKILSPEQLARLRQIMLQIEGPCALANNRELAGQLQATVEQRQRIAGVCQRMGGQIAATLRPPAPGQDHCQAIEANRQLVEEVRAKGLGDALAVLTAPQANAFKRMQGAVIELEPMVPPQCMGDAVGGMPPQ